jgi:hypothetical protein
MKSHHVTAPAPKDDSAPAPRHGFKYKFFLLVLFQSYNFIATFIGNLQVEDDIIHYNLTFFELQQICNVYGTFTF